MKKIKISRTKGRKRGVSLADERRKEHLIAADERILRYFTVKFLANICVRFYRKYHPAVPCLSKSKNLNRFPVRLKKAEHYVFLTSTSGKTLSERGVLFLFFLVLFVANIPIFGTIVSWGS